MAVIYRFDLIGRSGATMGGHVTGAPYTVETALAWALDDVRYAHAPGQRRSSPAAGWSTTGRRSSGLSHFPTRSSMTSGRGKTRTPGGPGVRASQ